MKHWIGRVDIPSGNITPIKEVDSDEIAWKFIKETNSNQNEINEGNSKLKQAKIKLAPIYPKFDKDLHGSIGKYQRIKAEIRGNHRLNLSEEDNITYYAKYAQDVIPAKTKLVYMAIHELKDM